MSVLTVPTANAEDELPPLTIRDVVPNPRALARQALPRVAEATLIPLVLFYVAFWTFGVAGALAAALMWSYGLLLHRLLTGRRVPGMVLLAAMALTVRTVIALVSGSVFAYFAAPVLGTLMVAGVFAGSLLIGQPLAQLLVGELGILPSELCENPVVQAHLRRVTMFWAIENVINAGVTVLLLLTQPLTVFLAVKTVVGWALAASCIAVCCYDFRRTMRAAGSPRSATFTAPAPIVPVPTAVPALIPAFA